MQRHTGFPAPPARRAALAWAAVLASLAVALGMGVDGASASVQTGGAEGGSGERAGAPGSSSDEASVPGGGSTSGGDPTGEGSATGEGSVVADADLRVEYGALHLLKGGVVPAVGEVASGRRGRTVLLEVYGERGWQLVDRAVTGPGGRFSLRWRPTRLGAQVLRTRLARRDSRVSASGAVGQLVAVYRASRASWYGPGFYGRRTACGGTIRPDTIGVAHKSLRCGTGVTLRYGSRSITVPVIDRGPYVGGREWDLTASTREALDFPSLGIVWSTR